MRKMQEIEGFSKLTKKAKLEWLASYFDEKPEDLIKELEAYWHKNTHMQKAFDEFSENTVTNFYMPYGIAPNFLINDELYAIPMVIEESSVVAAAAKSAKFWKERGGFHAEIVDIEKIGQVHFTWPGKDVAKLQQFFDAIKNKLIREAHPITRNMEKRGGGILDVQLVDMTAHEEDYYQLKATFDTCDSMGANFINSVLEKFAAVLREEAWAYADFSDAEKDITVIMSILSNYTPNCLVRAWVECKVEELGTFDGGMEPEEFVKKFSKAVRVAEVDVHRATTHNKGIFNGIDSVILATGNDFRAVEAAGHTYASRNGKYSSLTHVEVKDGRFKFILEVPMAVGTVGGLTMLHPLAKRSLELMGNPGAKELMMLAAVVGLANNFSALKSLTTVGIQKGHMKMHLLNILNGLNANEEEIEKAKVFFKDHIVSYTAARNFLLSIRPLAPKAETPTAK